MPSHAKYDGEDWDLPPLELIFGQSFRMALIRERIIKIAGTRIPVLLQGETGTGKEILAKLLHIQSGRDRSAWAKVMCPGSSHDQIESELFGYENDAFPGAHRAKPGKLESADGGTLFLDEIGSLDSAVQYKLLQALQDGTFVRAGGQESRRFDTRLICATNRDLQRQTAEGAFRKDLLSWVNAVSINLPSLRARAADIPALIDYFLETHARQFGVNPKPISRELRDLMLRYQWPGNIRELENVVRSYVLKRNEESVAMDLIQTVSASQEPEIDLGRTGSTEPDHQDDSSESGKTFDADWIRERIRERLQEAPLILGKLGLKEAIIEHLAEPMSEDAFLAFSFFVGTVAMPWEDATQVAEAWNRAAKRYDIHPSLLKEFYFHIAGYWPGARVQ